MPLKPLETALGLFLFGILVSLIAAPRSAPTQNSTPATRAEVRANSSEKLSVTKTLSPDSAPLDLNNSQAVVLPGLTLTLSAPEPVLRAGKLEPRYLVRRFALEPQQVQLSREQGSLEPLRASLEAIYAQLETRKPQQARFRQEAGEWVARGQTGWTVNRTETEKRLLDALETAQPNARLQQVTVSLRLSAPTLSARALQARGVVFHLASGQSSFAGSPDFRVHNIRVGSAKLDGLWLERGEAFDFNASVGRTGEAQGFLPGYVISGGTLALEDGGGICQVSTTVFRAAYLSGLPILERHAHSHAVAYYDPVGFEATVYAPNLNLRFGNDTAGALLMQASWDLKLETLRFDLFGTTPDRTVMVSQPKISQRVPARPPTFMPDSQLELGKAERVDMPASGMKVKLARRIEYQGKVRWDEIRSAYRPWGGVFAVHPRDPRLKE